ncbi:MAG: hypothetical protein ABIL09_02370 [Gemmatimonadota bacterium]
MTDELVSCRRIIARILLRAVRDAFAGDPEAWRWLLSKQARRYGHWVGCPDMCALVAAMRQMTERERLLWLNQFHGAYMHD